MQNLSKIFFFLICFFSLISLTTIFSIYKVEASGVRQVIYDSKSYDVYYLKTTLGEGVEVTPDIKNGDMVGAGVGCWYNGINDGRSFEARSNITTYHEGLKQFNDSYLGTLSPISKETKHENIRKALADKGFCAGVKKCKVEGDQYVANDSERMSYEWFSKNTSEGRTKFFIHQAAGGAWVWYNWTGALALPTFTDWGSVGAGLYTYMGPNSIQNCNKYAISKGRLPWIDKNGNYHSECYRAVKAMGENETDAKSVCQKFVCDDRNSDVREDLRLVRGDIIQGGSTNVIDYENPNDSGGCGYLERNSECKFQDPSDANFYTSCTFDNKTSTPDNCANLNDFRKSSDYGLTGAYANKNIFCSNSNKPVFCPDTVNRYESVFRRAGPTLTSDLITTSGCEYYTPPTPTPACTSAGGTGGAVATCSLDSPSAIGKDPHVCCFGSTTSNCSNTPSGGFSFDSKDKSGHKIYCASDNKVVRCPGGTRSYTPAPATSGVSGRASVFRSPSDLSSANKSTDCEVVPDPTSPSTSRCQLPESASCTFGSLSTSDNCYDTKAIRSYTPSGKPPMNLFCTKDDKTIACDSSKTAYDQAFPGLTDRGGTYTPASGCSDFSPGMDSIPPAASQDCEESEEGSLFFGGSPASSAPYTEETQKKFTKCLSDESKAGGTRADKASDTCKRKHLGGGVIYQCLCDVSYNPSYDFWRCNILPDENACSKRCILAETSISEIKTLKTQEAVSPLGLIRSISDFLFAVAVLIFIINMLRASFMYVTSGGDESKMKEAQSTITNTIFGMIFIVFIGALIRWVTSVATGVVTP